MYEEALPVLLQENDLVLCHGDFVEEIKITAEKIHPVYQNLLMLSRSVLRTFNPICSTNLSSEKLRHLEMKPRHCLESCR